MKIVRSSARLKIYYFLTGLLIGPACPFSNGQSGDEFRKFWQANKTGFSDNIQQDRLFSRTDFYNYARLRDEKFAENLKETWKDYSIFSPLKEAPRSSLTAQPVFNYSGLDITQPVTLPFSSVVGFSSIQSGRINKIPRIRKPEPDVFGIVNKIFLFYGQEISLSYDKLLALSATATVAEDSVSSFWNSFSRSNSNHLVDQLMDYRDQLGLGDWGYFQLVKAASGHIHTNNRWRADQLTWALMIRSGFDVRLAFNQNSTTLLFPSENIIYDKQFVVIGQERFYLDHEMNSQLLVTLQNPFPDTAGKIDLKFHRSLNFKGKLTFRKFLTRFDKKNYEFSIRYNPWAIRFYNDYPKSDPAIYFGAPVSSIIKEDLLSQFYPVLSRFGKAEAAAFLQQFVQRGLYFNPPNKKSELIQSRFAEEIIASKSGDDRSKAVLFSSLVRILLRLPVIGVQIPGCFSTAICFDKPIDGDYYFLNRRKYLITDPTFIDAPIGVMMPEFSGKISQLIDLPNADSQPNNSHEVWQLALKLGASRGGANEDAIFDSQGRAFMTGFFADKRSKTAFIACFSERNSLQWIRKFEVDGKATAFAITKVNDDEYYVAGSFTGKIGMDGKMLRSHNKNGDLFITQLNQNGELIWMKNIAIDSTLMDEAFAYLIRFGRTGDSISVRLLNEDVRNILTGFGADSERGLYYTDSGNVEPDVFQMSLMPVKPDINERLPKELSFLLSNKCHPGVAGLIAVMKMLQQPGMKVPGSQIQKLITRNNPSFSRDHPSFFNNIRRIGILSNEDGIISLKTIDNKPLIFNNLRFTDGARFKISVFANGDLSVDIISGSDFCANSAELSLNNMLIDYSSGNMTLDYDYDHTLKTVSPRTIFYSK